MTRTEEFAKSIGAKLTLPSRHLYQGHSVNLHHTDVAKTFRIYKMLMNAERRIAKETV